MSKVFFARAGRAGPTDVAQRIPELAPLQNATIAVFGLGTLGAPSVMEFARSSVKELHLVDYDFVDPATICRWPLGLQSVGLHKAAALMEAIARDYPFTDVTGFNYYLGAVRSLDGSGESAASIMQKVTENASLIYDATAEVGIQQYLSDYAASLGIPYIGVDATPGGWGGRIVRIRPGTDSGCWMCYRLALWHKIIEEPPMHPNGEIQPVGCADPTFTGAGFDMVQIALAAVRLAVSTLCAGSPNGYPAADWDVMTISLRSPDGGLIAPQFRAHNLERHPECSRCNQN